MLWFITQTVDQWGVFSQPEAQTGVQSIQHHRSQRNDRLWVVGAQGGLISTVRTIPRDGIAMGTLYHCFFKVFILFYPSAPGLSCSTWDLRSSLQHAGSLAVACGIPSSLTRNGTQAPCIRSVQSQPLDHQGRPGQDLPLENAHQSSSYFHGS